MSDPNPPKRPAKRPHHKRETAVQAAERAQIYAANRALLEPLKPGDWVRIRHSYPLIFIGVEGAPASAENWLVLMQLDRLYRYWLGDQLAPISPLDLPRVDLEQPSLKRLLWWLRYKAENQGSPSYYPPCPCCGYPNLGDDDWRTLEEPTQCIICAWTDHYEGEEDADRVRQIDPDDRLPLPEPNAGYSLTQARLNFSANGTMYAPDDPQRAAFEKFLPYSQDICRMLEEVMADRAADTPERWRTIYDACAKILKAQGVVRLQ